MSLDESLAVFAAVSVVAAITAQKTNGVNNIPPQQMMIPGEIQGGAASCRANMAELEAPPPCGSPYLLGTMLQGEEHATVTADDIARGWRVESVTTNMDMKNRLFVDGRLVDDDTVREIREDFLRKQDFVFARQSVSGILARPVVDVFGLKGIPRLPIGERVAFASNYVSAARLSMEEVNAVFQELSR